ncbi:hypothetical protein ABZY45_18305 [Streptomyces sp. NPDC006516]
MEESALTQQVTGIAREKAARAACALDDPVVLRADRTYATSS